NYNAANGTNFRNGLQVLRHDAADGVLNLIASNGGPTVNVGAIDPDLLDNEHTGVLCFARGTLIETVRGAIAVEELTLGDLIRTLDSGYQAIRWIGCRKLGSNELAASPKLQPVRIKAGALGAGLPLRDLVVSPQ